MSEIILKLPRRRNKLEIIRKADNIDELLHSNKNINNNLDNELINEPVVTKEVKTHFTHKFVITNSDKPIKISLNNVNSNSISIDDAKSEIQNAYDKGFSDGQDSTISIYENEINNYKNWIRNIEDVTEELKRKFLVEIKKFEEILIDSSCQIAEYLIDNVIDKDSSIIISNVKKTLLEVPNDTIFEILLNPLDVEILKKVKSTLFSNDSLSMKIKIIADGSIKRGGVILQTAAGTIDARISAQLQKMNESLKESLKFTDTDFTTITEDISSPDNFSNNQEF